MRLWLDEQSPALAPWIAERFGVDAVAVCELGLSRARDSEIFAAARREDAIVVTKDQDFVRLLRTHGPSPRVLWMTLGNTSNDHLRGISLATFPSALALIRSGEPLVEIRDAALVQAVES